MASDFSAEKGQLHRLIEPMLLSLLNAAPDDEPYTGDQRQQDAEAEASIARGEGVPHEEVLHEFGL